MTLPYNLGKFDRCTIGAKAYRFIKFDAVGRDYYFGADGSDDHVEIIPEDRLRALGYVVVRWTWRELMENPAAVAARIVRARALAATHRRAASGIWGP